jgi:hypothetical protein
MLGGAAILALASGCQSICRPVESWLAYCGAPGCQSSSAPNDALAAPWPTFHPVPTRPVFSPITLTSLRPTPADEPVPALAPDRSEMHGAPNESAPEEFLPPVMPPRSGQTPAGRFKQGNMPSDDALHPVEPNAAEPGANEPRQLPADDQPAELIPAPSATDRVTSTSAVRSIEPVVEEASVLRWRKAK